MGLETSLILGAASIATGAANASASRQRAQAQNRAIQASLDSQAEAAAVQQTQLEERAGQEIRESRREAERIAARARVLAQDAGIAFGDTQRDIEQSIAEAAEEDRLAIVRNLDNDSLRLRSGLEARSEEARAASANTALRTVSGFVGGTQTGINLGTSGLSLYRSTR